jgi:hypothetical protein
MPRDEMLYIDTEVKTIGTAQNVKDEIARSAYNIKVTDFVPFVNAAQPQRAINRQLEY